MDWNQLFTWGAMLLALGLLYGVHQVLTALVGLASHNAEQLSAIRERLELFEPRSEDDEEEDDWRLERLLRVLSLINTHVVASSRTLADLRLNALGTAEGTARPQARFAAMASGKARNDWMRVRGF